MATNIGIGFSQDTDTAMAAQEAAVISKSNLGVDSVDIALIFSTVHYNPHQIASTLQRTLNSTKVIGCSTAGIILSDSIQTRGIAVLTISSDELKFGIGSVEDLQTQDTHRAGTLLARNTLADFGRHGRHAFVFFVDGRLENNSTLLKGIQEIFGNVFPILGAGSCDDFHFADTFQIFQDNAFTNAATGLIIGGHANVGVGCKHGWRPLGKPRLIDKAEGNVIKTISGTKASQLYEEYFGSEAEGLRSNQLGQMSILYPLGIFVEGSNEYLLRNIVDIRADGSIVCQGDVPEGSEVHIMIGNKDSCQQAAVQAAEEAQKNLLGKTPKLIIIFESMARLKLLGRQAFDEIAGLKHVFGADTPLIGMYANGEISPFQTVEKFKEPYLLNESIVVLAVG
jgi:hypothetical protein